MNSITNKQELLALLEERCIVTLDSSSLKKFFQQYIKLVEELKRPTITKNMVFDLLHIKRDEVLSGPYPNVSYFEAANRICSDLTLLHGCMKIFKNNRLRIEYFECCFGTKHGVDLLGYNRSGKQILAAEVFCTSEKFFKSKFYKEKSKKANIIIHQKIDSAKIKRFIKYNSEFEFMSVDITQRPEL